MDYNESVYFNNGITAVIHRPGVQQCTLYLCECGKWVPMGRIKQNSDRIIHNFDAPHYNITAI